jgi:hypothetical protein
MPVSEAVAEDDQFLATRDFRRGVGDRQQRLLARSHAAGGIAIEL